MPGEPVHLTRKEYAILELMVLREGTVLTKEAFFNHLYGGMDEPEVTGLLLLLTQREPSTFAGGPP